MQIQGIQEIIVNGEFKDADGFYRKYPGSKITHVEGKIADEVCESCNRAITKGEMCYQWNSFVFTCIECGGSDDPEHKPQKLV